VDLIVRNYRDRAVYFAAEMLSTRGKTPREKCLVSGSGNVAQYTVEKINQLGSKAITLSIPTVTSTTERISAEKLASSWS
jgi:glutamate dehydrogenase (NADP+)